MPASRAAVGRLASRGAAGSPISGKHLGAFVSAEAGLREGGLRLAPGHEAAVHVLGFAIGRRQALVDDVREAVLHGFGRPHERLAVHKLRNIGALHARPRLIDVGDRRIEAVEQGRRVAHVVAVADDDTPGVVHHHEGAEAHPDLIGRHGDD